MDIVHVYGQCMDVCLIIMDMHPAATRLISSACRWPKKCQAQPAHTVDSGTLSITKCWVAAACISLARAGGVHRSVARHDLKDGLFCVTGGCVVHHPQPGLPMNQWYQPKSCSIMWPSFHPKAMDTTQGGPPPVKKMYGYTSWNWSGPEVCCIWWETERGCTYIIYFHHHISIISLYSWK